MYISKHVKNDELAIHYFDSVDSSDLSETALVACPGLSGKSETVASELRADVSEG